MDEYIDELLAEMPDEHLALSCVVKKKIMDEHIPEAVKRRLLKPFQPGKPRPSLLPARKRVGRGRPLW
ncbi:MAG: hypothetical protein AB2693_13495 [Candidatus Thiodiazotropha sp.]